MNGHGIGVHLHSGAVDVFARCVRCSAPAVSPLSAQRLAVIPTPDSCEVYRVEWCFGV